MKKHSLMYHTNTHEYLGNHPKEVDNVWSENAQGLAHDADYWYISNDKNMFKYHVETNLSSDNYFKKIGMPQVLKNLGYKKFKALCYYDDHILVPVAGADHPAIAMFKASDLSYVDHFVLDVDWGSPGWCTVNPRNGFLYMSASKVSRNHPLYVYRITFENNYQSLNLEFAYDIPLRTPFVLKDMQGGVFSPDGLMYLINGYFDRGVDDGWDAVWEFITPWESDIQHFNVSKGGISVYGIGDYKYMDKSSQKGSFRYQWDPDWMVAEEPEGMTFWDLDADTRAPHIEGQVHALLLDNDEFGDDIYIKHYRISEPKPVKFPWLYLVHTYLYEYPGLLRGTIAQELKGITHDDEHWFFATGTQLWKVPVDHYLDQEIDGPTNNNHIITQDWPDELSQYDEVGDICHVNGFILVPLSSANASPVIAAFRANNLRLVDWAPLSEQSKATWCGVRAVDQEILYTSGATLPVYAYELQLNEHSIELDFKFEFELEGMNGQSPSLEGITGGETSMLSGFLYLAHGGEISVFHSDGSFVDSSVQYSPSHKSFGIPNVACDKAMALTLWEDKQIIIPGMEGDINLGDIHAIYTNHLNAAPTPSPLQFSFRHFEVEQPTIVGNRKTREMHRKNCVWERKMAYKNKIPFSSAESGLSSGFDGCYYCLRHLNER